MKPGKTGIPRLLDACRYSAQGLRASFAHEAAFRQELALALILLPLSFFVAQTPMQWLALVAPLLLVLIVELLNSAVENVVDRIGNEPHELSGRAKDMGSAAVLFSLILLATSWAAVIYTNLVWPGDGEHQAVLSQADAGQAAVTQPAEPGRCKIEIPREPGMCTMDYNPVCGCDGKTYSNACVARNAGIGKHRPGACEEPDRY